MWWIQLSLLTSLALTFCIVPRLCAISLGSLPSRCFLRFSISLFLQNDHQYVQLIQFYINRNIFGFDITRKSYPSVLHIIITIVSPTLRKKHLFRKFFPNRILLFTVNLNWKKTCHWSCKGKCSKGAMNFILRDFWPMFQIIDKFHRKKCS